MSAILKPINFQKTKMMKKLKFIIFALVLTCSFQSFSQVGYLGRRFHFIFDARFTPTLLCPYKTETKFYEFNTHFSPGIEFIINKDWVIGGNYQFQSLNFAPEYTGYDETVERYYNSYDSKINLYGFGFYAKYYTNNKAPLGYYYKLQVDYWIYYVNSPLEYEEQTESNYKSQSTLANYIDNDWALGFRIEFGKTIFLSNYISIGTGVSAGTLTKGYKFLSIDDSMDIIDRTSTRLLFNYFLGVNLTIGILPF